MTEHDVQPTFNRVLIDKDKAEELLGVNVHNRNVRDRRVRNYAIDMLNGEWLENGETIKVDKEGKLLDGQHRLLALVKAATDGVQIPGGVRLGPKEDLAIWFNVAYGLDRRTQRTMDIGASRSLSDVLRLDYGEQNTTQLAAIIRMIHTWEAGYRKQIAKRDLATNATVLAFYETNPELFRSLANQVKAESRIPLSPSVLALCHYLLEERDAEDAAEFFSRLADGQGLYERDPIYELRERLRALRDEKSVRGTGHQHIAYTLALVIKAWNAWRNNEKIGVLSFKMGGKNPENFPEPM